MSNIDASMRVLDDTRGAVRMEDVYDTGIDDLWEACTSPERLARWIAQVSGDRRTGGMVQVVFTSTWSGAMRIEVCDAPSHLLLTAEPETEDETQIEVWLTAAGSRTRLVVEERGLPVAQLHFFGAGWQVHLEDLGRSLTADAPVHSDGWSASTAAPAWHARWTELTPAYRQATIDPEV